jgi:hypothetical protein
MENPFDAHDGKGVDAETLQDALDELRTFQETERAWHMSQALKDPGHCPMCGKYPTVQGEVGVHGDGKGGVMHVVLFTCPECSCSYAAHQRLTTEAITVDTQDAS